MRVRSSFLAVAGSIFALFGVDPLFLAVGVIGGLFGGLFGVAEVSEGLCGAADGLFGGMTRY